MIGQKEFKYLSDVVDYEKDYENTSVIFWFCLSPDGGTSSYGSRECAYQIAREWYPGLIDDEHA